MTNQPKEAEGTQDIRLDWKPTHGGFKADWLLSDGTDFMDDNEFADYVNDLERMLAAADHNTVQARQAQVDALRADAERLAKALLLTRDYVGEATLPAIEGWSWFDALEAHMAMRCAVCSKGPMDGVTLYRVNEKGVVPAVWACREHRLKPSPVQEIVDVLEQGQPR